MPRPVYLPLISALWLPCTLPCRKANSPRTAPCDFGAACHFLSSPIPCSKLASIHLPSCFFAQFPTPTFHLLCLLAAAETEASHCLCCFLFGSVTARLLQCSNFSGLLHMVLSSPQQCDVKWQPPWSPQQAFNHPTAFSPSSPYWSFGLSHLR